MRVCSAPITSESNFRKPVCYLIRDDGATEGEWKMTIYTWLGAPVQILEAEKRRRWCCMKRGRFETFDTEPTKRQLKGATEVSEFDIWWIKAKQIGVYPDGTGAESIGQLLSGPVDKTKRGFRDVGFFYADDGIREIYAECEMKR